MLGFFKQKRVAPEPAEFLDTVLIERPAAEVYALLDWADPRNAQRARGNEVTLVSPELGRYRLRIPALPDHDFAIAVSDAAPDAVYAFAIQAQPRLGRIVWSHEHYSLEALSENSCRLTLVNTVMFDDGLGPDQLTEEWLMVTAATHNAVAKLKIQAEQGVDAVEAVADRLIV